MIKVYCDGGSRGNPGPAGIGVVIEAGKRSQKLKKYLGNKTNNQAEYEAVLFGAKEIVKNYPKTAKIDFYLDSQLVVRQLSGDYKIKNEKLFEIWVRIRNLIIKHSLDVSFFHIPRAKNHRADDLVNMAIDQAIKSKR
jgi:ribonuclease HI